MSGLHFESDIDDRRLDQKLKNIERRFDQIGKEAVQSGSVMDNSFRKAESSSVGLNNNLMSIERTLLGLGAVTFLGGMVREIATTRGEWQKYEAVLTNTLGSNNEAIDSLEMIAEYGAKTNFQVNELTDSYVKLASQGFVPVKSEMVKLGDLAASKAKSFDQLTEALIDAETFEFERLKEFGIRASKQGDQIIFTFKGIKTTVDASAESVRNYILSLGEMEGVKGATEAISKTIVGLASNFEDAVDKMFNKMGKEQEGLIAGSIKLGTKMVDNYENVISVLKALVVTYGAAKVAMMIVAYQRRIEAAATLLVAESNGFLVMSEAKAIASKQRMIALQQKFNKSMLANPYVLAAAAIGALGYAAYKYTTSISAAEKAMQGFNKELDAEKAKIDDSFGNLKAAEEGTERYKAAKDELISTYGNYIPEQLKELNNLKDIEKAQEAVNSRIRENIALKQRNEAAGDIREEFADDISKRQIELFSSIKEQFGADIAAEARVELENIIAKAQKEEVNIGAERDRFLKRFNMADDRGIKKETDRSIVSGFYFLLTDIQNERKELEALNQDFDEYIRVLDSQEALKPYQKLFKDVSEYSEKQLLETKAKLTALLGEGLGPDAETKIKTQIDAIAERLSLPTVKEQLKQISTAITEAENKLAEMRAPGIQTTIEQIEKQESVIKKLKKDYETLSGEKEIKISTSGYLEAVKNIDKLKKKLGTGDEKYEAEILLKIAEEQKFIDDFNQKVRDVLKRLNNDTEKLKPIIPIGTKGTIGKKEVQDQLKPMKQLTQEDLKRLKIQEQQLDNLHEQQILYEDMAEGFDDVSEIVGALSFAVSELDEELGEALGRMADMAFNASDLFANLAAGGDPVSAISAAIGLVGNLFGMFKKEEGDEVEQSLDRINKTLERQSALMVNLEDENWFAIAAKQVKDYEAAIDASLQKLRGMRIFTKAERDKAIQDLVDSGYPKEQIPEHVLQQYMSYLTPDSKDWDIDDFIKAIAEGKIELNEAGQEALENGLEGQKMLLDLLDEGYQKLLGFTSDDVASQIADGIKQGFKLSEDGLGDFSNMFGELMQQAVMQSIITGLNDKFLFKFMEVFEAAMADKFISEDEREALQGIIQEGVAWGKEQWDIMKPVFDKYSESPKDESQDPLTGEIRGITEVTGSLIAGQFMAMRVDMKSTNDLLTSSNDLIRNQFEIMDQSLNVLQNIEKNTRHNSKLGNIENGINETNRILKEKLW